MLGSNDVRPVVGPSTSRIQVDVGNVGPSADQVLLRDALLGRGKSLQMPPHHHEDKSIGLYMSLRERFRA